MLNLNPIISQVALTVNVLNIPIKMQMLPNWVKEQYPIYTAYN